MSQSLCMMHVAMHSPEHISVCTAEVQVQQKAGMLFCYRSCCLFPSSTLMIAHQSATSRNVQSQARWMLTHSLQAFQSAVLCFSAARLITCYSCHASYVRCFQFWASTHLGKRSSHCRVLGTGAAGSSQHQQLSLERLHTLHLGQNVSPHLPVVFALPCLTGGTQGGRGRGVGGG